MLLYLLRQSRKFAVAPMEKSSCRFPQNAVGSTNSFFLRARGFAFAPMKKLRAQKHPHLPQGDGARSLGLHVRPALLGDDVAVLVEHNECRDPPNFVVGFQRLGRAGAVFHAPPIPVRLLHVGLHVLRRVVGGNKDYLQALHFLQKEARCNE